MSHWPGIRIASLLSCVLFLTPLLSQNLPPFRIKEEEAKDWFRKGLTFYNSGQYIAAREFFFKALNRLSHFHLARRYLGDANFYSGEWNSALEQWEFLDKNSDGAYPLIRMRSDVLRFKLNGFRSAGPYVHFRTFDRMDFPDESANRAVDTAVLEDGSLLFLYNGSANVIRSNAGVTEYSSFKGRPFNRMKGPVSMAVSRRLVYVCDYTADRIRVFTESGSEEFSFGSTGSDHGQLRGPAGIAVSDDAIFVSDSGNRRIEKFDKTGKYLLTFVSEDELSYPAGLTILGDSIYAADRGSSRIIVFDQDGNLLDKLESDLLKKPRGIASGYSFGDDSAYLLLADEEAGVLVYDLDQRTWTPIDVRTKADLPLNWSRPFSARTDRSGILYVSEFGSGKIHMLLPESLRVTNLDMRIERVDTSQFPDVAVFLQARNRIGNFLPGLTRREIKIFENDRFVRGIRTDNLNTYQNRLNLQIIKENSKLMATPSIRDLIPSVLRNFLTPVRISDQIQLTRAGQTTRSVFQGQQRRQIIQAAIEGESVDEPDTGKALFEGVANLIGALGPRAVVCVVSGDKTVFRQYDMDRVEHFARAHSIPINFISFDSGQDKNSNALSNLARATGGKYVRAYDDTAVSKLYEDIRSHTDERYLVTYKSGLTTDLADRYIEVRADIDHQGMTGSAEGGYFVPKHE